MYEVWFIFKVDQHGCWYLMDDECWSKNRDDVMLMSEKQASDECGDHSCGSMTVLEATESIKLIATN